MKKYSLLQTNYVALLGPSENAKQLLQNMIIFEKELANVRFYLNFPIFCLYNFVFSDESFVAIIIFILLNCTK